MPNNIAVFGGGCFWCLEAVFQQLQGVEKVTSGYAGGGSENPSYEEVSSGTTGHAEVVQLEFNPDKIKYRTLLEILFTIHDPTTLNRQGNDVGEQYRSIILYIDDEQRQDAEKYIQELTERKEYTDPIVTEVVPLDQFYSAEDYHQNYYNQNSQKPYCQLVISPKIKKFKEKFGQLLKE
jgi:peptide-methionine (S)-S-oxide reductase